MPRIVCGSSAGSIISAIICSRPYDTIHELFTFDVSYPSDKPIIKFKTEGLLNQIFALLNGNSLVDTNNLKEYVRHFVKDLTF
jgi:predicted acylesterase/phospholipase RssA